MLTTSTVLTVPGPADASSLIIGGCLIVLGFAMLLPGAIEAVSGKPRTWEGQPRLRPAGARPRTSCPTSQRRWPQRRRFATRFAVSRYIARYAGPLLARLTGCHCRSAASYAYPLEHLTRDRHFGSGR